MLTELPTSAVAILSTSETISWESFLMTQVLILSLDGSAEDWLTSVLHAAKFGPDWFFWIPEDEHNPSLWSRSLATGILTNGTLLDQSWDPWRACLSAFHQMR